MRRQPRPLVLAGDLNQRLPRNTQPEHVHRALIAALVDLECPAHLFLTRAQIVEEVSGGARRARSALLAHDPLV